MNTSWLSPVRRRIIEFAVLALLLFSRVLAGAQSSKLLNVDFTAALATGYEPKAGPAATGYSANDYWNVYSRDVDNMWNWRDNGEIKDLLWADGSKSSIALSVQNAAGAWGTGAADPMLRSYLYPLSRSGDMTVTLKDLPAAGYDLYFYAHGEPPNETGVVNVKSAGKDYGTQSTSGSADWNPATWVQGRQFVLFRQVEVVSGEPLTITVSPGEAGLAVMNGLQLLQAALNDGIPDEWRLRFFGPGFSTNPEAAATADPDGDGANNFQEYLGGTDPLKASSVPSGPISVSTFAGSVPGGADGYRTNATFVTPSSLTFDANGQLWITESTFTGFATTTTGGHRIRRMGADQIVHTVSGSAEPGLVEGPAAGARFSGPNKVAFDHQGNVFVADRANHRIRKIDPNGIVSTFAGSSPGYSDGVGTNAQFNTPITVVSDASDNLYVADFENLRIRKITPQGVVSTYAGSVRGAQDGPLASATFDSPNVLAFGPDGSLFVSDWNNGRIRKIKDGQVTTFATGITYIDGVTTDAQGNVYAVSNAAFFLAKYTPEGQLAWSTPTGQGFQDGPIEVAKFGQAVGAPVPAPDGTLLVYDVFNSRIRQIRLGIPPLISISPTSSSSGLSYILSTPVAQGVIHFTLDGSVPTVNSPVYSGPILPIGPGTLNARLFVNNLPVSPVVSELISPLPGLLAAWTLDESSGSLAADAFGELDGLLAGAASFDSPGVQGSALSLRREGSGVVNFGDVLSLQDTSFTWAVWIRMQAGDITENSLVLAKHESGYNNGYFLDVNRSNSILGQENKAMFFAGDPFAAPVSQTSVNDGQWHQLVAVHEAQGNNLLYVDGHLESTVPAQPVLPSPAPLLIGGASFNGQPQGMFTGLIDEVQVYSRALTQVDVTQLYSRSSSVPSGVAWVSTLAGSGVPGNQDGLGSAASFNAPNGGFVGPDGAAYIADTLNHSIRRVDLATGRVTTIAGTGTPGFTDGPAATAQFSSPLGTFFDASGGALFVADTGNNRIRKVSADNPRQVGAYAGSGLRGYLDGPASVARFDFPNDLAMDAKGNIYVTEFNNHTVRKISPSGMVSTFVGSGAPSYTDGTGTQAGLNQPAGLAIDKSNNLYVTEWGSHRIRRITPDGLVSTLAGSIFPGLVDAQGPQARFFQPDGIVVDPTGVLFVTETGNHTVRRISPDGLVSTVAGTQTPGLKDGLASEAEFRAPGGIGIDKNGNLIIADTGNHRIRQISTLSAPQVVVLPQSPTVAIGAEVTLTAQASGTAPLTYQWKFNGADIPGASDQTLNLGHLQVAQSGSYSVSVSNPAGTTESQSILTVVAPIGFNRILPAYYSPARKMTVRLESIAPVPVIGGASAYAVEEFPPQNWTVGTISQGGVYDPLNRKVKFGPFFDFGPRVLSYDIIPPVGASSVADFHGIISADGNEIAVGGKASVLAAPLHPADVNPADHRISINEITAYAGAWRQGRAWTIDPNPIPIDYMTRAGLLWKNGEFYTLDPSISQAPLWWVSADSTVATVRVATLTSLASSTAAIRALPANFMAGESFTVTLSVAPAADVNVYALEEHLSAGVTVLAVSDSGQLDSNNEIVRWGPFFDATPRTVTYQAMVLSTSQPVLSFEGVVSADGASTPVGGAGTLAAGIRIGSFKRVADGQFEVSFNAADGQSYVIETSSDLRSWSRLTVSTSHGGVVQFQDPQRFSERFYRILRL